MDVVDVVEVVVVVDVVDVCVGVGEEQLWDGDRPWRICAFSQRSVLVVLERC